MGKVTESPAPFRGAGPSLPRAEPGITFARQLLGKNRISCYNLSIDWIRRQPPGEKGKERILHNLRVRSVFTQRLRREKFFI